jgi:hypothetical protein
VVKHAGRGKQQDKPDQPQVLTAGRIHHHGFTDKTAEEREGRNGRRPDDAENAGQRHGPIKPADIRGVDLAGAVHDRAHGHEQEAFEQHIVEGMRHGPVDRQLGADADAADHEAHLVDQAVGQDAPQVVFDHGKENRESGHGGPDINQGLCPG